MDQQPVATPQDATPEQDAQAFDNKILAKFGLGETEDSTPQTSATPADSTGEDDLEVEVPEDAATPESFEWDITHNGQSRKVTSKDEATRLMQQGFDYDFKMSRLNGDAQRVQSMAQAVQAQHAMQAQALDALADAKSYERQLRYFANVDWVQETNADPVGTFQKRMQYDQLVQGYQQAHQRAQQLQQPLQQAQQHIDTNQIALEMQKLQDRIPEWKDAARREKDGKAIQETMMKAYGFAPQELSSPLMNDHRVVALLRDAWKYREAVNTKANKGLPQGLPAVARPGAKPPPRSGKQQLGDIKRGLRQVQSPEARKALEDELIAQKFGLK